MKTFMALWFAVCGLILWLNNSEVAGSVFFLISVMVTCTMSIEKAIREDKQRGKNK